MLAGVTYGVISGTVAGLNVSAATGVPGQVLSIVTDADHSLTITGLDRLASLVTITKLNRPYGGTMVYTGASWSLVGWSGISMG